MELAVAALPVFKRALGIYMQALLGQRQLVKRAYDTRLPVILSKSDAFAYRLKFEHHAHACQVFQVI